MRRTFAVAHKAYGYSTQLRKLARQLDQIVIALQEPRAIAAAVDRYSDAMMPWVRAVVVRMLNEVAKRDASVWGPRRREIEWVPMPRELVNTEVDLVRGMVRKIIEWVSEGRYNSQLGLRKANSIAQQGISHAATVIVKTRSQHMHSEGYIWRTKRDSKVRHSHGRMEGQFVRWDDPPSLDGFVGHAGELPSCRCWPEPVVPEVQ